MTSYIGLHFWQFLVPSEFRNPTDKVPSEPSFKNSVMTLHYFTSWFHENFRKNKAKIWSTALQQTCDHASKRHCHYFRFPKQKNTEYSSSLSRTYKKACVIDLYGFSLLWLRLRRYAKREPVAMVAASLPRNDVMTMTVNLRARRALSLFRDVPLRTRRVLSTQTLYSDSALLVLKGSLNIDSALLALNWRNVLGSALTAWMLKEKETLKLKCCCVNQQ